MLKYRNMQIQHKLIASFAAILAVVLVLAVSNYTANTRIHSLSQSLEENAYMAYKDGSSLMENFTKVSDTLTEAIGFSDSSKLQKAAEFGERFTKILEHLKKVAPTMPRKSLISNPNTQATSPPVSGSFPLLRTKKAHPLIQV